MKLHDPAFEARLRARVRPHWKAAMRKHGALGYEFWRRHRDVSGGFSGIVIAILASALLPRLAGLHWSPRAIGAYTGLACTVFCVMISGLVRAGIGQPKELPTLLWWPAADEVIGRWGWQALQRFRRGAFFPLLAVLGWLALAMGEAPTWPSFFALLLAATVGAAAAAGLVVLPISRRGMQLALAVLLAMIALLILQPQLLMRQLGAWLDETADVLAWLHPGGWLVGVFQVALHPQGWRLEWLLIVPLVALAESTRYWRRRFCAAVDSAALLEKFEAAGPNGDLWMPDEPPLGMGDAPADTEEPAALREHDSQTARQEVQALRESWRAALPPLTFEGRFQHWLYARLSARERLLCEALGLALPSWQRVLGWSWKFCAAAWVLAWVGRELHWTTGGMMAVIVGVVLLTCARIALYVTALGAAACAVWRPVGYAEIRRLEWKRWWPIVLLVTPWLVLAGCAVGWLQGFPWWWSGLAGLKLCVLAAGLHPWLVVCKYSTGSGDTNGWRWSTARLLANLTVAIVASIGGLVGACLPVWPGWVLMAVAVAATWRLYAVHRRQWDRRKFDVGPGAAG